MTEFPESSDEVVGREPCPSCGSSDNLARYSDGHAHCFGMGCGYHEKADGVQAAEDVPKTKVRAAAKGIIPIDEQKYVALPSRGLTQETCEKFKYGVTGRPSQIAPYFDDKHQVQAQKVRGANKKFSVKGDLKKALPLFGQILWRDNGKKIVITEGEIDAMSVSQVQDHKWPVVSIPNGAAAARKAMARAMDYLEGFEEIILMFDMDEPGQEAAEECAQLFPHGKVKIASLPLKDANAMLVEGRGHELINAIWAAKTYSPESVSSVSDLMEDALKMPEMGMSWPWPTFTDLTYGVHRKKAYALGAGVGVGKTNWAKEHQSHLVNHHKLPVGVFMLEEAPGITLKGIAGKIVGKPFHKPNGNFTQEDLRKAVEQIDGMVSVYRHDLMGTEWDDIKPALIYMVEGLGIKDIFLDNVTVMVSHLTTSEINEEIGRFAKEMAHLLHKHDFTLYLFSHLNPPKTGPDHEHGGKVLESQFTGSRALMRFCQYMLGIERNKDPELPEDERNTSKIVLLKDRDFGNVGYCYAKYNPDTDQYLEVEPPNPFDEQKDTGGSDESDFGF